MSELTQLGYVLDDTTGVPVGVGVGVLEWAGVAVAVGVAVGVVVVTVEEFPPAVIPADTGVAGEGDD